MNTHQTGYPAIVYFTKPGEEISYGMGFGVTLAVPPKEGDYIRVDRYSIKKLRPSDLHETFWKIVEWSHELNLDANLEPGHEKENPAGSLHVVVHPAKEKPAKPVERKKKGR
jgi:hypothetical protein